MDHTKQEEQQLKSAKFSRVIIWTLLASFLFQVVLGTTPEFKRDGVFIAGDVILGGLFPVHSMTNNQDRSCSDKIYDRGIQRLEAMLYAIDEINKDPNLLKGIKLGANILDTCGRDTYALNKSLEFIRASINTFDVSQQFPYVWMHLAILNNKEALFAFMGADKARYECGIGGETPRLKFNTTGPIFGVVGGSYSSVSIQVANLLRLFHIPQISPASTAKVLSDKSRFELFARTVPPDTFQAIALMDIVKSFNWTYISTIASEGSYGEQGVDVVHKEAEKRNICIAISEKVPSDASEEKFLEVVGNLFKKPNAKGVVLFTRAEDARRILKAAKTLMNGTQHGSKYPQFYWLASDGWGKQSQVVSGIEDFALGAITVELESNNINGFDEYMKSLTPEDNERNMWFRDYWEDLFKCDIDQTSAERRGIPNRRRKLCNPRLRLSDLPGYEQDSKVQFVIHAVYAFAHALDALKMDVCPGWKGLCPAMTYYDGREFYKNYLLRVDFQDVANSTVKFDDKGDGLARYTIYNYQRNPDSSTDYKVVGKWFNTLKLNASKIVWSPQASTSSKWLLNQKQHTGTAHNANFDSTRNLGASGANKENGDQAGQSKSSNLAAGINSKELEVLKIPASVCSFPCNTGEIMVMNTGDTCCWICQKCLEYEFMFDEFTCQDCGNGRWPHPNKTSCFDLPLKYMRWDSLFAIIPICIACVGILLTLATWAIFLKYQDTPLVRASGRELSYVILSGLMLSFLNTFILLAKPGVIFCTLRRFTVGIGFSMTYGALLTKTNRISRIFHSASQSARRPSYISPKSQLIITAVLVSVQFTATLIWVVAAFPNGEKVYPQRSEVILKCNVNDSSFLISQVYNMVLITVCTYYAIKTRKVPENFNEAKFIGFTMYTTCIIWLAFIPIFFGTGNSFEVQITTLCISISLSAYVTLTCLFSPKLYIIVFQPEKNVRKLTMNSGPAKKTTTSLISTAANAALATNNMPPPTSGTNPGKITASSQHNMTKAQVVSFSNTPSTNSAPPEGGHKGTSLARPFNGVDVNDVSASAMNNSSSPDGRNPKVTTDQKANVSTTISANLLTEMSTKSEAKNGAPSGLGNTGATTTITFADTVGKALETAIEDRIHQKQQLPHIDQQVAVSTSAPASPKSGTKAAGKDLLPEAPTGKIAKLSQEICRRGESVVAVQSSSGSRDDDFSCDHDDKESLLGSEDGHLLRCRPPGRHRPSMTLSVQKMGQTISQRGRQRASSTVCSPAGGEDCYPPSRGWTYDNRSASGLISAAVPTKLEGVSKRGSIACEHCNNEPSDAVVRGGPPIDLREVGQQTDESCCRSRADCNNGGSCSEDCYSFSGSASGCSCQDSCDHHQVEDDDYDDEDLTSAAALPCQRSPKVVSPVQCCNMVHSRVDAPGFIIPHHGHHHYHHHHHHRLATIAPSRQLQQVSDIRKQQQAHQQPDDHKNIDTSNVVAEAGASEVVTQTSLSSSSPSSTYGQNKSSSQHYAQTITSSPKNVAVTNGGDTVPLEMCQDIPDVLI